MTGQLQMNSLATDLPQPGPPPDQDLVLIGATGDLARRKLLPALYEMSRSGMLPRSGRIIGYARNAPEVGDFRSFALAAVGEYASGVDPTRMMQFIQRLDFVSNATGGLGEVRRRCTQPERLVYLATPPSAYARLARDLQAVDLVEGTRLLIEKPFGNDLESSRALHDELSAIFDEARLFRIDHYLGKETVRNILVFRFGNSLFERSWNRDAIDHVQLTVAESEGVDGRGSFYEEVGALRDVMQNHLLQLLALLAMEPPVSFAADAVRAEQAKLLEAVQPMDPRRFVRGQYTAESPRDRGYREEPGVSPVSYAETYAAAQIYIDNWRWSGVPFFLRTGKRLMRRVTELQIVFRPVPTSFFSGAGVAELPENHLAIRIQPEQGISFNFAAKVPGPRVLVHPARMQYLYGVEDDAYERLLYDAMRGDQTLFVHEDALDASWKIVQPVIDHPPPLHFYPVGSWGPPEADELIHPRAWHLH